MRLSVLLGSEADPLAQGGETEIRGLTADSRHVQPGYLFAALPGVNADGARFVGEAVAKGAVAVLGACDLPSNLLQADNSNVALVRDANPRRRLALMASHFYGRQPDTIAAVTGTNGKTSVASFLRQIWQSIGFTSAAIGTLGVSTDEGDRPLGHTTPDPVVLHEELAKLVSQNVTHLVMEASSHGLAQYRLDGVRVAAAGFTNITRDHLDYHPTFEDYRSAKMRLFSDVLMPGGVAVLNADTPGFADFAAAAAKAGHKVVSVGFNGETLKLKSLTPHGRGQAMCVDYEGAEFDIDLPLIGAFQASNVLIAAGLAIATGADGARVFQILNGLRGAPGRLDIVATLPSGAMVLIDYAHTPDALDTVLDALRPHVEGKLSVVFGCGGDRDTGKRPQMGAIARSKADRVYVTDDNPRSEEAAVIRREIMAACSEAREIGPRAEAIETAMAELRAGDVLVVAGKGHETGQIVGAEVLPFSDHDVVTRVAQKLAGGS